jgi:diguanylate cyclase (GGDEF)-like protein
MSAAATGKRARAGPGAVVPEAVVPEAAVAPVVDPVGLDPEGLDRLLPMALRLAPSGRIRHAGPTLARLRPQGPLAGRRFLDLFELRRPRGIASHAELAACAGQPLSLRFRDAPQTAFKGLAVPVAAAGLPPDAGAGLRAPGAPPGELLVNLSFGIGAVEALSVYDLNSADFAATDLTVAMLYLVEANEAVQQELRRLNRRLQGARLVAEEQAFTDRLTGLQNRRGLDRALRRYARGRDSYAVMQLDLDYFKEVNDRLGHAAGDHVLQRVAEVLREETREADTLVRAGGDEFVLIFHRIASRARLARIAGRLLRGLEQPIDFEGAACRISASIGIAISHEHAEPGLEPLLQAADAALYDAKRAGRGRYGFAAAEEAEDEGEAGDG